MATIIDVPRGLTGVAVADTTIGDVRGDEGFFHYRQYDATELARHRTFEDVVALVLDGALPAGAAASHAVRARLGAGRRLPDGLVPALSAVAGQPGGTAVHLRAGLALLGAALGTTPLLDLTPAERTEQAWATAAAMPTLVAALHRLAHGHQPIAPDPAAGVAADYVRMVTGTAPDAAHTRALEQYLILTIDHGFNTGTFAARVVASTGTDLASCVVAGFGALSGPRHGADTERILAMFEAIGEPDRAEAWLRDEMANRRRLQGFGHAVYRATDPRLALLKEHGAVVAPELHRIAVAVEEAGTRLLAGRRLVPNIDLHAAVVLEGCGVPRGSFTAAFATARIAAWCAHAMEQVRDDKVLRPAARYVGPPPDDDVY